MMADGGILFCTLSTLLALCTYYTKYLFSSYEEFMLYTGDCIGICSNEKFSSGMI